jgi:hypothetical protein
MVNYLSNSYNRQSNKVCGMSVIQVTSNPSTYNRPSYPIKRAHPLFSGQVAEEDEEVLMMSPDAIPVIGTEFSKEEADEMANRLVG